MRCCASLFVIVALLGPSNGALAQSSAPGAVATEAVHAASVAAEVAAAIGECWNVNAERVVVELISDSEWPASGTEFRLIGSGADGRWAVWFDEAAGARQLLVRAGVQHRIVTAARDLERGTHLGAADFTGEAGVQWGPPGAVDEVKEGWVTRRRIARGETIRRPAAEPPRAVKSGDSVRIEVVYGALTLSTSGRAAGSAAVGETVVVRAETGKRLEGVVIAPGLVRIGTLREGR